MQTTLKSTASVSRVTSTPSPTVSACFDEVSSWMRANRLQVNPSKTEVLWCASGWRQYQIPTSPVRIGSTYVLPVSSVRDLRVHIDSDVSLRTRHRHCQIVLCSTTSDSERSALSSTTCPADTNLCFGCQQGWLLLLRAGRCLRSSTGQAAVHPQRRRPTRGLNQALWTHHPVSPRPSLVAGPGTDSILSQRSGIPMSQWIRAFISRSERSSDSRYGRSSPPPLFYHHDACCSVSAAINSWWLPFLSLYRGHGTAYHLPSELFILHLLFGNNWRHICLGSVLANLFTTFLIVIMTL